MQQLILENSFNETYPESLRKNYVLFESYNSKFVSAATDEVVMDSVNQNSTQKQVGHKLNIVYLHIFQRKKEKILFNLKSIPKYKMLNQSISPVDVLCRTSKSFMRYWKILHKQLFMEYFPIPHKRFASTA